jgi:hypothetical protein
MGDAEREIRTLAAAWMSHPDREKFNLSLAEVIDLFGDGNAPNEIELLLINLGRASYPDRTKLTRLYAQYLEEKADQTMKAAH